VGFHCKPFGEQSPAVGGNRSFCQSRYDVSFPMTPSSEVNGPNRHPGTDPPTARETGTPANQLELEKFLMRPRDGTVSSAIPPRPSAGQRRLVKTSPRRCVTASRGLQALALGRCQNSQFWERERSVRSSPHISRGRPPS